MSALRDLPWPWIGGALVVVLLILFFPRGGSGRRGSRSSRGGGYGHPPEDGGYGSGDGQASGRAALLRAAEEVRGALERQTRELGELRVFWLKRLEEIDGKLASLAKLQAAQRRDGAIERLPSAAAYAPGADAVPYDSARYGAESLGRLPAPAEPAWSPGPGDQPVEVRDGVLVASRSLPPAGFLSASGSGPARVYLNAEVPLTEYSLPKWAAFFDLDDARPYASYRTRRPAQVRWDEAAGRGELVSKGTAEAI
jgi:hypothetical protein